MMTPVSVLEQRPGQVVPAEGIAAIVRAIAERFAPEQIVLFGSYAHGDPTPDSDVDLLVVMDTALPPHQRAVPILLLFNPMPCALDVLVYTPAEIARWRGTVNHIITEAFEKGKVLYERR